MQVIIRILKAVILFLISALIYNQIISGLGIKTLEEAWAEGKETWEFRYLWLCIMLMPVNWILESMKWKALMKQFTSLTWRQSLRTILLGLTFGVVTPARLGEYGGRLLGSDTELKAECISATFLSSVAQNICNVLFGVSLSYFFLKTYFGVTYSSNFSFIVVTGVQIFIGLFIYYNLPKVVKYVEKTFLKKFLSGYKENLKSIYKYEAKTLHIVLGLSALRYLVYLFQYVLILMFLGARLDLIGMCSGISAIYLIQTGIPLPAFLSILARGEIALMVWSYYGLNEMTSLIATFGLWMINLIIPACIGLVILMKTNVSAYFRK